MKEKNIGINAILNVIKSCLSVIFPLITYPYALRILGADGIGKVTYGESIVSYFLLIAMLGITTYAVREGAKRKKNKEEFNRFANEIFTINVASMIVAYSLLAITLIFVEKLHAYTKLIMIQSLVIAFSTFGLDWINTVYEDFLFITIRSILAHIITLIMLFVLVKKPSDYYMYALLAITTNGITCISNWFYCRKYAKVQITLKPNISKHAKPILILFANAVAVSIYVNFDTTMLGWMQGDYYVGLYAVAVRVYTIVKNILVAIYAVTIPRLAYLVGKVDMQEYRKLYSKLWEGLTLLLIPAVVGLVGITREVMLYMGGKEYLPAVLTLQILSVALLFAVFGGLVTSCLNVTLGREKNNLIVTICSAILNCTLNFIFIPLWKHNGAAVTTLLAEMFVVVVCIIRVPNKEKYFDFIQIKRSIKNAVLASMVMGGYIVGIKFLILNPVLRFIVIVPGAILLYSFMLLMLKEPFAIEFRNKIKKVRN